ncbi:hypothetical protein TWF281_005331 [Arthrobotrys megalospora]
METERIGKLLAHRGLEITDSQRLLVGKVATEDELERIIRAIYRFWIIIMVWRCHQENGIQHIIPDHLAYHLFDSWNFWDFMTVKAVHDFLWDMLLPYSDDGRQAASASSSSFSERYRYGWYTFSSPRSQFVSILWKDFPINMVQWVDNRSNPDSMIGQLQSLYDLKGEALRQRPQLALPSDGFTDRIPIYLNNLIGDYSASKDTWRMDTMKRIWLPAQDASNVGTQVGSIGFVQGRNIRHVEFRGSVWDEWRLKGWGFSRPKLKYEWNTAGDDEGSFLEWLKNISGNGRLPQWSLWGFKLN